MVFAYLAPPPGFPPRALGMHLHVDVEIGWRLFAGNPPVGQFGGIGFRKIVPTQTCDKRDACYATSLASHHVHDAMMIRTYCTSNPVLNRAQQ
jgi:hypothetical protein